MMRGKRITVSYHTQAHCADRITRSCNRGKIRVSVTPGGVESIEPESAVVPWVNDIDLKDIRGSVCHHLHFFSSPETVSKWIAEHQGMEFYPVNDVFQALIQIQNKHSDIQTKAWC